MNVEQMEAISMVPRCTLQLQKVIKINQVLISHLYIFSYVQRLSVKAARNHLEHKMSVITVEQKIHVLICQNQPVHFVTLIILINIFASWYHYYYLSNHFLFKFLFKDVNDHETFFVPIMNTMNDVVEFH